MAKSVEATAVKIPALNDNLEYHAFVSHSSDDRHFAEDVLAKRLEDKGFKCFVYERDLPVCSTIVAGVMQNISKSRRVILVITETFIESRWSVFEAMQAVHKGYDEDRMVLVPVLYDIGVEKIPHYLRPYPCLQFGEDFFWNRLESALIEDRPATALIPAGNVAHGLAWSYYYGFLKLVLPGLRERTQKFLEKQDNPPEMLMKMVIIIPSSCWCPKEVTDFAPEWLKFVGFIDFSASRAGNVERSYKSSVYKVTHPDTKKEYLFIAEFATPVLSIYEMETGGLAGLNAEEKVHQRMLFSNKIKDILDHPANRESNNKATLLEYNDEEGKRQLNFPVLLCEHLNRELMHDKKIQEHVDELTELVSAGL